MDKLLIYSAPINTLGDNTETTSALGILVKFDYVILGPHSGPTDVDILRETIRAAKIAKPTLKVFGYTALGDASDMANFESLVTAWTTNLVHPAEALLDGIFIDLFGFENTFSTRANQITAVNYIHGLNLSAMVNSGVVMNAIGIYTGQGTSTIGSSSTIKDYIFLDGFYFAKSGSSLTHLLEPKDALIGRLSYVAGAKADLNIGVVGLGDMAEDINIPVLEYKEALSLATQFGLDAVGFAPKDWGDTSHDYFLGKKINDFNA